MPDSYVCIDLETTGLNPKTDKIIEIGAVKVENGEITDTFLTFVQPGRKLEEKIIKLTGITDEMLQKAPVIDQIIDHFLTFVGELPIMGHSVLFDYSFVKKAAVNARRTFEKEGLDTLKIARKYLPELPSRRLDYLCDYYKIPHTAHRAIEDAKATIALYNHLTMDFYKEDTKKDFDLQRLVFRVKRESPASKLQKERLYHLIALHKIKVEYDVETLTRNEASRYTDRILAAYGR